MKTAANQCATHDQDVGNRAAALVEEYLRILMIPDPDRAMAYVAPDLCIRFTGGREMHSPAACAAFNATRYAWVKKKFERTEVVSGATDPEIEGVEVVRRAALAVSPADVLAADGYLLGTPANLGYMSGALKHAFDVIYYPCLDSTHGRPFGLYVHGNEGTEGAERGVTSITTGLGWVKVADYVVVSGKPTKADLEACWNLGATVAAQFMEG